MATGKKTKHAKSLEDERGEYRPIYTVLIHGPDYQALAPKEKLVLLHLKLNLGPAGIGVLYQVGLAEQTGYSEDQIRLAIEILSGKGWLAYERNVFWVIDGLKYEPSLSRANDNHKRWLARHLKGLPNLNIVKHFCDRYREWLPRDWQWDADGITQPIPITSTTTSTSTTTKGDTSPEKPRRVSGLDHLPKPLCDAAFQKWGASFGAIDYGVFRKELLKAYQPGMPIYTQEELLAAIDAFHDWWIELDDKEQGFNGFPKFVSQLSAKWVPFGKMPLTIHGELTERGAWAGSKAIRESSRRPRIA